MPITVDAPEPDEDAATALRERLRVGRRRVVAVVVALAGLLRARWRRRRVRPLRWLRRHAARDANDLGWAIVAGLWPRLVGVVQSTGWCVWWRDRTDAMVGTRDPRSGRPSVLRTLVAVAWVGGLYYLDGLSSIWTEVLAAPAVVVLLFVVGRLEYRHTGRGRARGRYRPDGFADHRELQVHVSARAVKTRAVSLQPSIRRRVTGTHSELPSALLIAGLPVTDCGTWLGDVAIGTPWPAGCYADSTAVVGMIAPTQSWKTALMAHHVIDAPGAVISTQTKPETFYQSAALRSRRAASGRVELLDPDGLTGHPSTIHWPLVRGCADPGVAQRRAARLAEAAGSFGEDNGGFVQKATTILRTLLLVADVAGYGMDKVYAWGAADAGDPEAATGLYGALRVMRRYADRIPGGWVEAMAGLLSSKAERQRSGFLGIVAAAVDFMSDPNVAALCRPADDGREFDVAAFLADRGALYLIAEEREHASAGPFLSAFADHVVEEAKRLGARRRLDPPLRVCGDEIANTIVLPIHRWLSDSAGRGLQFEWSAQSRSQLRERWGDDGADTIWNNTTVKLAAGGITVPADLRDLSELTGTRLDPYLRGDAADREVPVMTPDDVRRIPDWHALLVYRSDRATLVRIRPAWRRADVLASRLLAPAPVVAPTPMLVTPQAAPAAPTTALVVVPDERHDPAA